MTIDQVLELARQEFTAAGRLDVAAFARAHPEHADLPALLPALVELWDETLVHAAAAATAGHAMSLLREGMAARRAAAVETAAPDSIGQVVARLEQQLGARAGAELAEAGLPAGALAALRQEATPVEQVADNATVQEIARRIGASFRSVRLALSRLVSLDRFLQGGGPAMAFTRGEETGAEGRDELAQRVREALDSDGTGKDPADPA